MGSSGSCDTNAGWCMYQWNQVTRVFDQLPNEGGCNSGYHCPTITPAEYGGSAYLDSYEEFRAIVCCQADPLAAS